MHEEQGKVNVIASLVYVSLESVKLKSLKCKTMNTFFFASKATTTETIFFKEIWEHLVSVILVFSNFIVYFVVIFSLGYFFYYKSNPL